MKNKSTFVLLAAVVMMLTVIYQYTNASSDAAGAGELKIAVVRVLAVFEGCQRNEGYKKMAEAEENGILAELDKLSKEVDATKAGLKTLKADSVDYMSQMQKLFQRQANFQAQEEFYKQSIEKKNQQWTEELYTDIVAATREIAEREGISLVLEKSDVDFPAPTPNELMLSIRTSKVLYAGGCRDITEDVIKLIDTPK